MAIKTIFESIYGTARYGQDRYGRMVVNDDLPVFEKIIKTTFYKLELVKEFTKKAIKNTFYKLELVTEYTKDKIRNTFYWSK